MINKYFQPVKLKHQNIFENIFRRISGPIARILAYKTNITPNQVTCVRIPIAIFMFYQFSIGEFLNLVIGGIGIILWEILDHVDGDLAVVKNMSSQKGHWLESVSDTVFGTVSGFLGLSITIGIYRQIGGWFPWLVFCLVSIGYILFKELLHVEIPRRKGNSLKEEFEYKKDNSTSGKIAHFFYYWVEMFIIVAVILYIPFNAYLQLNTFFLMMIGFAVMYNSFWIMIIYKQYKRFRG